MKDDASSNEENGDPLHPSKYASRLAKFPKPDLNQMIPFSADLTVPAVSPFGPHVPEVVSQFIMGLPSGTLYEGPLPNIDLLLGILLEVPLPPPPEGVVIPPVTPVVPATNVIFYYYYFFLIFFWIEFEGKEEKD
jgi:hypothetical protein